MRIQEIDNAIQTCQLHVDSLTQRDPKIESYLTSYLLILIAIHFEKEIKQMVIRGVSTKNGGKKLNYYLYKTSGSMLRGLKTGQLSEYLGNFGDKCKNNFASQCSEKGRAQAITAYNNIITNRHNAAHQETISMTLKEVIESYEKGNVILDLISESLRKR